MLVALTLPDVTKVSTEINILKAMLDSGLSFVHLRKPSVSMDLMGSWLRKVPCKYKRQIVWHLPYSILGSDPVWRRTDQQSTATFSSIEKVIENIERFVSEFAIRRVHVPAWFREKISLIDDRWHELLSHELSYSTSIHHMKELAPAAMGFKQQGLSLDYVTVSPVFDSLSKIGYKASTVLLTDVNAYKKIPRTGFPIRILALGGVNADNIGKLKTHGFDGAVLNGSIWHPDYSPEMSLHHFKTCYKKWRN